MLAPTSHGVGVFYCLKSNASGYSSGMTETTLWALFLAIVQLESGGDLKAKNGKAVGPAQIQPGVVLDCIKWGHAVEMRDRETLEGSFRLFRLYTDRWIAYRQIADTPQNRANIWRHGPSSKYVLKGLSSTYSLKAESVFKHHDGRGVESDDGKRRRAGKVTGGEVGNGVNAP